jgi:hypothetical protein
MPEWYLAIVALGLLGALGVLWTPLLLLLPCLALAVGASATQAFIGGKHASFTTPIGSRRQHVQLRALTTCLFLIQPLARLYGRMRHGLTVWRQRERHHVGVPRRLTAWTWSETWQDPLHRLRAIEVALRFAGARVRRGGDFHDWDLEVESGLFGHARLMMAVEEHGAGRQLIRLRAWPKWRGQSLSLAVLLELLSMLALIDHAWLASGVLGLAGACLALRMLQDASAALTQIVNCAEFERDPEKVG